MGRFSRDNSIEAAAFERQNGLCGACGKALKWECFERGDRGAWTAHHIDANPNNNTLSNCVCLCVNEPEDCHLNYAHHGDYNGSYLAPKRAFEYFHG